MPEDMKSRDGRKRSNAVVTAIRKRTSSAHRQGFAWPGLALLRGERPLTCANDGSGLREHMGQFRLSVEAPPAGHL